MKIETFWEDIILYHVTFLVVSNGIERPISKTIALEFKEDQDITKIIMSKFDRVIKIEAIDYFDEALLLKGKKNS